MSHADDLSDSGLRPNSRAAPITIGEARRAVKACRGDGYDLMIMKFLLRRVERLERTVKCSTAPTCDKIAELSPGHQSLQDHLSSLSTREFVIQCLVKAGLCLCPALRDHHEKEKP